MSRPIKRVMIIGRPNVGKSTLFNRIIGKRKSLVLDFPGVTRDLIEEEVRWDSLEGACRFTIVDSGGLEGDLFPEEIQKQIHCDLERADLALFILDAQKGIVPEDEIILSAFRKQQRERSLPIIAVANKVDQALHEDLILDFYRLGIPEVIGVSAEHGRGIETLKEAIIEHIGHQDPLEVEEHEIARSVPRIAIVGKPNVGKSTLANSLLKEKRMITSSIPGTTVDAIEVPIQIDGTDYLLIDTAGMRRKCKTEQGVEVLSVVQTRNALEKADLAFFVIDGSQGTTDQDEKIAGLVEDSGCSVIIIVNKWDTQNQNTEFSRKDAIEHLHSKLGFLTYAPIVFASALYNRGLKDLGAIAEDILSERRKKISTHELTEWIRAQTENNNPKNAKFYLSQQVSANPPSFVCFVSDPKKIHFSLKSHLKNAFRKRFDYPGTPIRLKFAKSNNL